MPRSRIAPRLAALIAVAAVAIDGPAAAQDPPASGHQAGRQFLYSWTNANRGRLPAVSALVDDGQWPTSDSQAAHPPLRQLYYARTSEFARRFREIYGRSVEEVEAEWIRYSAAWTAGHGSFRSHSLLTRPRRWRDGSPASRDSLYMRPSKSTISVPVSATAA